MDEAYLLQILSMFFFSVWKTYLGPIIAAASNFSYWEMLLFNMGPALSSAGATLFVTDYWMSRRKAKGFSKNLRKALRFWKRFGKHASLFLAPIFLGIPSYVFISRRLKARRSTIIFEISIVVFIWCSCLFLAAQEGLLLTDCVSTTRDRPQFFCSAIFN